MSRLMWALRINDRNQDQYILLMVLRKSRCSQHSDASGGICFLCQIRRDQPCRGRWDYAIYSISVATSRLELVAVERLALNVAPAGRSIAFDRMIYLFLCVCETEHNAKDLCLASVECSGRC